MARPKNGSIEVEQQPAKGEGKTRRCYLSPEELIARPKSAPEVDVLTKVLERSARLFPNQNAVGWRDLIKMHEEEKDVTKTVGGKEVTEKKKWQYFELSDYKYWTYKELYDAALALGSALVAKGITKDTVFNIYASTSYKWQAMAQGCASQGITFATAYDSLGDEGLQHSLSLPECRGVFTNANLLETLARVIDKTPTVKLIVYDGEQKDIKAGVIDKLKQANENIEVIHFDEFLKYGRDNKKNPNPPTPEDIACIMFTSGSTGAPKGVLLSNANCIAAIAGVEALLGSVIRAGESYIAYLPLAHIMEFVVECCMMYVGAPMGYGTVKTLTDNSVRNCVGDIRAFKPTIMVGVPAVWELIRKGILAKVKAGGAVKQKLFNGALSAKKAAGAKSIIGSLTDAVVFSAVKQGTGGRLRWALSGGAPISRETQEFLSLALVTVLQGYGMTESTAMCAILPPEFHQYGTVGVPVPSVEVKLVDVPDANYFSTSDPPEGEIWIRGPSVTKGYYKQDDITKETINEDGWLATGDIGRWNKDGTLSLIDRKKNLVKLSGGEYIALERLESIYKSCQYVSNLCVYATSDASKPMAIVFPHEQNLKSAAGASGDLASMCQSKEVRDTVLRELNAVGKKAGLKPLETLQTVILTETEWTPQNYLTAAQKLNRKVLIEAYKSEIDKVYP